MTDLLHAEHGEQNIHEAGNQVVEDGIAYRNFMASRL